MDACADPAAVAAVAARREGTVCVSALTGGGVSDLLASAAARLREAMVPVRVLIPYSAGDLVDEVYRAGVVRSAEYTDAGTEVRGHVPLALASRLAPLQIRGGEEGEEGEEESVEIAGEGSEDEWETLEEEGEGGVQV